MAKTVTTSRKKTAAKKTAAAAAKRAKSVKRSAARSKAAKPKPSSKRARVAKTTKPVKKSARNAATSRTRKSVKKSPRVAKAARAGTRKYPSRTSSAEPSNSPVVADFADRPVLSREEFEHFREMLLAKRADLVGDVSTLHDEAQRSRRDAAGDLSTMPIHMADLGTDNYERELTLGLIEGERALLNEIDEALVRIQDGRYGRCLATGKPIGKARLKAKPWAQYCYEYTLAQEKGQAHKV